MKNNHQGTDTSLHPVRRPSYYRIILRLLVPLQFRGLKATNNRPDVTSGENVILFFFFLRTPVATSLLAYNCVSATRGVVSH